MFRSKIYEVLLILALGIGFLAAIVAPKILDVTEEEMHERAVGDVAALVNACSSWWIDGLDYSAKDEDGVWISALKSSGHEVELISSHQDFRVYHTRRVDPWGNPYEITTSNSLDGPMLQIRCFGADGREGPVKPPGPYDPTTFDTAEDIVWADGFWVRYPAGTQVD